MFQVSLVQIKYGGKAKMQLRSYQQGRTGCTALRKRFCSSVTVRAALKWMERMRLPLGTHESIFLSVSASHGGLSWTVIIAVFLQSWHGLAQMRVAEVKHPLTCWPFEPIASVLTRLNGSDGSFVRQSEINCVTNVVMKGQLVFFKVYFGSKTLIMFRR